MTKASLSSIFFFFFNDTATTEIYPLSLHDALPIFTATPNSFRTRRVSSLGISSLLRGSLSRRSEEHTSELQSQSNLVCRLLLEKKKQTPPSRLSELSSHLTRFQ